MYKLATPLKPVLHSREKLEQFVSILKEEVEEVTEILEFYEEDPIETFVRLGDWFGDLIIYCNTKAREYGLPIEEILEAIMRSNFSKLGDDGSPIYDDRGKVLKGPMFCPPEPLIREIIKRSLRIKES